MQNQHHVNISGFLSVVKRPDIIAFGGVVTICIIKDSQKYIL